MTTTVPLRVRNVDLDDYEVLELTDRECLEDISWSSIDGVTIATIFVEPGQKVVGATVEAARRIQHVLNTADVVGVYEDLVSSSDIATRVGVSREAVRTWARRLRGVVNFPEAIGSVGGGTRGATKVWAWADVVAWLSDERGIDLDETFPSKAETAEINACLASVATPVDNEWRSLVSAQDPSGGRTHSCLSRATLSFTPAAVWKTSAMEGFIGFRSRVDTSDELVELGTTHRPGP